MGKKHKKPNESQRIRMERSADPPSPAHAASEAVIAQQADPNHPNDPRVGHMPGHVLVTDDTETKAHRYVGGARVPNMPPAHTVAAVDLTDAEQAEAMRKNSAPSMPNGMAPGPNERPAVRALGVDDLRGLTE